AMAEAELVADSPSEVPAEFADAATDDLADALAQDDVVEAVAEAGPEAVASDDLTDAVAQDPVADLPDSLLAALADEDFVEAEAAPLADAVVEAVATAADDAEALDIATLTERLSDLPEADAPEAETVDVAGDDSLLASVGAMLADAPSVEDTPAVDDLAEAEQHDGAADLAAAFEAMTLAEEAVDAADLQTLDGVTEMAEVAADDVAPITADAGEDTPVEAEAPAETVVDLTFSESDTLDIPADVEPATPESYAEAATTDANLADIFAETTEPVAEDAADDLPSDPLGPELRRGSAEKLQRARARVIRVRRSDDPVADAAQAEANVAEVAPAADLPEPTEAVQDAPAPVTPSRVVPNRVTATPSRPVAEAGPEATAPEATPMDALLSPEDEAELQRELAALRRNDADHDAAEDDVEPLTLPTDARRGFSGPSADEALSRLMKQTDNEMEGTDIKRRQSAIAHLKAAVAATVADRIVTGDKPAETETTSRLARYRNDLAMVVRAALPGARAAAAQPQGERPAPLVLVSEQRIDRPRSPAQPGAALPGAASATPAPIRPRRISNVGSAMQAHAEDYDLSDDEAEEGDEDVSNLFGDTRGFAEFVDRIGATSLEQILEASAAYMSGIEGRPHFSRPQLMRHLGAVVPQGAFQREDGLRSFGTLLRTGKIAKVRRGQFALSEDSAYLAEARQIAG
ncbi:MAG: hypothetical protein RLZZ563_684, partial [Pseudomonadota bacterium]